MIDLTFKLTHYPADSRQVTGVHISASDLRQLVKILSVERNLLEYVLYRLVAAKLVLTTNDQRYVMQSLVEVEDAVDRLRSVAFRRDAVLRDLTRTASGTETRVTLSTLAEHAPTAERYMLIELQADYVRLAHQIAQVSSENRRLADLSLGPTAELLSPDYSRVLGGCRPSTKTAPPHNPSTKTTETTRWPWYARSPTWSTCPPGRKGPG